MSNKMNLKRAIGWMFLVALMLPLSVVAQTIQVKGHVADATGLEVIGASILEKGTTNGVITDLDGNFTLDVDRNATLVVSYVGYITQEIAVQGKTQLNIVLKEDNEMLDEVVVIGYGTMKKSDMTGAITSVDTDELTKRATTNPAEALQGKIAGVNIAKSGGNAGAGVSVKIRGVKSFGSNEPLYIIDGFPGDIANVNPQDIQSMEVLKDGAAAAIYGSVAANGVIIITTKNGKKGETHVDFNTYLSITQASKKLELCDANLYKQTIKTMFDNYNAQYPGDQMAIPAYVHSNSNVDTDWQDLMLRTGSSQNYMMSVRGGSETAQYSVSYNHADDKGIFLGNNFRQDNARMKLHASKYIFDFDANLSLRYTKSQQPQYALREMYGTSPLLPVYDENEKYGFALTQSQQLPANNGKQLLAKVKEAQGAVLLTVTDLYGQTFTAEMTPEHVTGLFTAKNTQLSVPAVKEGLETLLGSQLQIPARFKLAGEVSGSFEGNFFEYTVPVKAVDVANLTQGNIVFYHQQLLKNQWKDLATFASLIKELGIDGIRVVYADVDSDKKVKQAFPWRSIFEE